MKIVKEQRYIKKQDGKYWLQCKYIEKIYIDASGAINISQSKVSEWEDVPICLDDWDNKELDK